MEKTITQTFTNEHSDCDKIFAQTENLVANKQWSEADTEFTKFHTAMEKHFTAEEEILFPTFEERTGQTMGPTQVMRMEHTQMRQIFTQMQTSLAQRDDEQYLGLSETLLMLMQQHNMKEEQMLYPMIDQVFGNEATSLIERIQAA
ncbi:MAG: hemerythrin domain-containing protein [Candidatus Marithrix sp.]|nr:hemerythrin domain-containing protein [Candidatus Marithrix sp.]